jgi:hypothetical protein
MKEMAQVHHVSIIKKNPNHCISILGSSRYLRKLPRQHFWFLVVFLKKNHQISDFMKLGEKTLA